MSRLRNLLPALLLLVLTGLVYAPGLGGDFVFDDFPNIVSNPRVQATTLDAESLARAAGAYEPGVYGRPLATVSFAIDHVFWGKDPTGYKLTSLGVHLLNGLLVFLLVLRLLRLARPAQAGATATTWAALAVAAWWSVHPLQVSTVLYVVQRMEMLAHTFVLLGLLAYLRGRERQQAGAGGLGWLLLSGLAMLAGLASKETAILLPGYALALELTLLHFDAASARTRRWLKAGFAALAAAALVLFLFWVLPRYAGPGAYDGRDFDLAGRLLSQCRVLPLYLLQMLLPLPSLLPFYYDDFAASTGWLSPPTTLLGALLLAALAVLAWRLRRRLPLVSLGLGWFFCAHALTSNVINLELVFEHRNYFALLGVLLAVADLVMRLPMRDGPALKRFAVVACLLLVAGLGTIRAATWGDPLLLATDLVAKAPNSPRASNDLAVLYAGMAQGNPDSPFHYFAMTEFERGSQLPGSSPLPEQGLILLSVAAGETPDPDWWRRIEDKLRTRPIGPQETMAVDGLLQRRYEDVPLDDDRLLRLLDILDERGPVPPHMLAQYADFALTRLQDRQLAERLFLAAVDQPGSTGDSVREMASILVLDGEAELASKVLEKAKRKGLID